ncbi:MAG: 5'-nucleotidase C-terminal domain-containing protein [Culicoidibacterales bacterium]
MKKIVRVILSVLVLIAIILPSSMGIIANEKKEIALLATSDMHNHFYPHQYATNQAYPQGSLAKVASVIKQQKTLNKNTIVIDNGDTIQDNGSALFLTDDVLPMIAGMNAAGYDTWTAGNHEFNYGIPLLEKAVSTFKGTFLLANVYKGAVMDANRLEGAKPYTIINRDGVRVAIIGVVTPNITKWDAANLAGYTVTDPEVEVAAATAKIRANNEADIVVVSFHASLGGEYEGLTDSAAKIAQNVSGIDAIVCGHEHSLINTVVNGVPIVEPGRYGEYVSKLTFNVTPTATGYQIADKATDVQATNIKTADFEIDPEVATVLQPYHQRAITESQTVIGNLVGGPLVPEAEINGITQAQIEDTPLIDLILKVQMEQVAANVDIPADAHQVGGAALFTPTANVQPGEFKKADAANVYKFDNTLMSLKVNGAQLKQYMEWSAKYFNQFTPGDLTVSFNPEVRIYNYDMFGGVNYTLDISEPVGQRMKNIVYSDTKMPVADTDVIYLSVNNYRANTHLMNGLFGTNYEVVYDSTNDSVAAIRDMVGLYVQNAPNQTIEATVDNNWKLTGYSWNNQLHEVARTLVNKGDLAIPLSSDGRTPNIRSLRLQDIQNSATVIDLLSVNDIHGAAQEAGKNIGVSKFAAEVKRLKGLNPHTVFLGAGDLFQGSALSNLSKGDIMAEVFKELGMEYSAIGNHEFDWGISEIPKFEQKSGFKFLSANIVNKADPTTAPDWAKPYAIIEKNGRKIGLIGLITPTTAYQTVAENVKDISFLDVSTTAAKWEKYLREEQGVDTVIALTHISSAMDQNGNITGEVAQLAAKVPGLDGIFSGHSHQLVNGISNGVPVVQGMYNGRALASMKVIYDNTGTQLALIPGVDELYKRVETLPKDEATDKILAKYLTELEPILGEVIGTAAMAYPHEHDRPVTEMGQMTAEMMTKIGKTDISVINGGAIRAGLEAGNITMGNMYTIFPFDNTVVTLKLKGSDLKRIIEHGIKPQSFRPGQFYGINVWYSDGSVSLAQNAQTYLTNGVEITSMRLLDGTKIDMETYYSVTTLDFIFDGGDMYDFSGAIDVNNTGIPLREKIVEQIKKQGTITHAYKENLTLGTDPTIEQIGQPQTPPASTITLPKTGQQIPVLITASGTVLIVGIILVANRKQWYK